MQPPSLACRDGRVLLELLGGQRRGRDVEVRHQIPELHAQSVPVIRIGEGAAALLDQALGIGEAMQPRLVITEKKQVEAAGS